MIRELNENFSIYKDIDNNYKAYITEIDVNSCVVKQGSINLTEKEARELSKKFNLNIGLIPF